MPVIYRTAAGAAPRSARAISSIPSVNGAPLSSSTNASTVPSPWNVPTPSHSQPLNQALSPAGWTTSASPTFGGASSHERHGMRVLTLAKGKKKYEVYVILGICEEWDVELENSTYIVGADSLYESLTIQSSIVTRIQIWFRSYKEPLTDNMLDRSRFAKHT